MRRFSDAKAALPQKSDCGGAPSLPWRTSALPRGSAEKRLCPFSLIAPCLLFPTAPKRHSESKREAGADRSGTGFFVSLLKSQAARVATTGFAVLRRFTKTYPPMPQRSRSEAATWPGSGTAADAASPSSFTHGVVANGPSSLPAQAE